MLSSIGNRIFSAVLCITLCGVHRTSSAGIIDNLKARIFGAPAARHPSQPQSPTTGPIKTIWIFDTSFMGEMATRMAVAQAFPNAKVRIIPEDYDLNSTELSFLKLPRTDFPDLIVHTLIGNKKNDALLWGLKQQALTQNHTLTTVVFGDPKKNADEVDLVVLPPYFEAPHIETGKIIRPSALPSSIKSDAIIKARDKWNDYFASMPYPRIAVLMGGQAAKTVFEPVVATDLGVRLSLLARNSGGSLLVTNSRRTPEKAFQALLREFYGFPLFVNDARSENQGADQNPYLAYIAFADFIVVTGDSISMVSDAVATGKPVYVYAPESIVEDRHRLFIAEMFQSGRVRPLSDKLEKWTYTPPNPVGEIKSRILKVRGGCELFL